MDSVHACTNIKLSSQLFLGCPLGYSQAQRLHTTACQVCLNSFPLASSSFSSFSFITPITATGPRDSQMSSFLTLSSPITPVLCKHVHHATSPQPTYMSLPHSPCFEVSRRVDTYYNGICNYISVFNSVRSFYFFPTSNHPCQSPYPLFIVLIT